MKRPLDGTWLGTALRESLTVSSSSSNGIEFLRRVLGSDCIVAAAWATSSTGSWLPTQNIATCKRQMSMVSTWAGILLDPFASNAWQGLRESNFTGVIAKITVDKTEQASKDDVNQFVSLLNRWSTSLTRGKQFVAR